MNLLNYVSMITKYISSHGILNFPFQNVFCWSNTSYQVRKNSYRALTDLCCLQVSILTAQGKIKEGHINSIEYSEQ